MAPPTGSPTGPLWRRMLSTFAMAMLGAGLGYFYAAHKLPPELMKTSALPAMYASTGAVSVVLVIRMFGIIRALFFDRS